MTTFQECERKPPDSSTSIIKTQSDIIYSLQKIKYPIIITSPFRRTGRQITVIKKNSNHTNVIGINKIATISITILPQEHQLPRKCSLAPQIYCTPLITANTVEIAIRILLISGKSTQPNSKTNHGKI